MGLLASGKGSGSSVRIEVTPDLGTVGAALERAGRDAKKEIGKLHEKHSEKPIKEIKKRANALGSGRVRIGRAMSSSASQDALTIQSSGFPDFMGQEYGALQYRQFLSWAGSGDDSGYVIGAMVRDDSFMTKFGEEYQDGLEDLIDDALNMF